MSKIVTLLFSLLFNAVAGAVLATTVGLSPLAGAIGMNVVSGVIGETLPAGTLRAGVLKEIWTGELVKSLRAGLEGSTRQFVGGG